MSHLTHVCQKCGHTREGHNRHAPYACASSGVVGGCICPAGDFSGPSELRETIVPAWVDSHPIGSHTVTPFVRPGGVLLMGGGPLKACDCSSCIAAADEVSA